MIIAAHRKVPWLVGQDCKATEPTSVGCFGSRKARCRPHSRQRTKVLHPSGFFFVPSPRMRRASASRSRVLMAKLVGWEWLETSAESRKDRPASQGRKCPARSTVDNLLFHGRIATAGSTVVRSASPAPVMGWGVLRFRSGTHRRQFTTSKHLYFDEGDK